MDYQEFVSTQFIPRITAVLNGLKTNLVNAGGQASNITVTEVTTEGVNDLRYRIVAKRGQKTLTAYMELTASGFIDGQMAIAITVWIDGNGNQISTSYAVGNPVRYDDPSGLEALLLKLESIENLSVSELLTNARAFLGL